ncbi:MAG TPA: SGNH/GDSL hydrolase family protein [Actinomycetes bacterium]|jgi:lysophospholipase L1-like esterase|nr:SGNH/GDSL hydrolase family protein [Actinomycetes bacterium]
MRRRVLLLVGIPVLLSLLTLGPASAEPDGGQPPMGGRPLYLALGDSVAAGVGASDRAVTGYVPRLYDLLREEPSCQPLGSPGCRSLVLRNLAVGGATSTTLLAGQLPAAVAELRARNGDQNPRNDVEVVTIDIGGNDVFGVVPSCTAGPTPQCLALVQARLTTFATNFTQILGALRAAAGPGTVIVAMTYYNPLASCDLAALAPLADVVLEGGPGFDGRLNDLIRRISAANGVAVAETYGKLGPADLVGGSDCLHPNDSGHQIIAEAFAKALAEAQAP